jgi:hypothetical protein
MNKDEKLLGILNIVWGSMGVVGGLIGGLILLAPTLIVHSGLSERLSRDDETVIWILGIIGICICAFAILVALPCIIGGIGLVKKSEWARTLILVVSFIHLLAFPLGTALGVYGIYVLWNREVPPQQPPPLA